MSSAAILTLALLAAGLLVAAAFRGTQPRAAAAVAVVAALPFLYVILPRTPPAEPGPPPGPSAVTPPAEPGPPPDPFAVTPPTEPGPPPDPFAVTPPDEPGPPPELGLPRTKTVREEIPDDPFERMRTPTALFGSAKVVRQYDGLEMVGLRITKVSPGSFWEQVGIQSGDLIVEADGESVTTPEMAIKVMNQISRGDRIRFWVETQDGERRYVEYDAPER